MCVGAGGVVPTEAISECWVTLELDYLDLDLHMVVPSGQWESNPGSPEEQPVLLTAEPSLQPC